MHTVNTVFNGGMAFSADIDDHIVVMDAGHDDGGINSGPSPKRLMLASLAGCTGIDIVSILDKMKVAYTDFSITVNAHVTEEHPKVYDHVKITYTIKLPEAEQPKMVKAVNLSQDKYCGVSAMFRAFAKVETHIVYL